MTDTIKVTYPDGSVVESEIVTSHENQTLHTDGSGVAVTAIDDPMEPMSVNDTYRVVGTITAAPCGHDGDAKCQRCRDAEHTGILMERIMFSEPIELSNGESLVIEHDESGFVTRIRAKGSDIEFTSDRPSPEAQTSETHQTEA